ncbi:M12 family metallo-peptidase [Alteromonas flava]|uniref:M12 family metallo-peptidase n=1 Tax=Alteromonas flava TaxID=2048003 RepID=UPI000C28F6B2|nr:M12 family metallo-peptidase [Alteromonas flava]
MMPNTISSTCKKTAIAAILFSGLSNAAIAEPLALFSELAPQRNAQLPAHVTKAFSVKANRKALLAAEILIDLPDLVEPVVAIRTSLDRSRKGLHVWSGHVQGDEAASVIITFKGSQLSGLVQWQGKTYRLTTNNAGKELLYEVDLASLPSEEADGEVPRGDSAGNEFSVEASSVAAGDTVTQDLLVVYTQGACNYAGSCTQLEADIVTAIADLNNAYAASGINITMNLAGAHLTDYSGTNASETLSALRSTTDGVMDEVHQVRDQLNADIVSLIYDGQGCGIGYLGSSATSAFNVTDVPCMVGNRTLAHEIGHNQGAHHDRQTVGGGVSGAFNYGYRRCSDGSIDDAGSPYFRTIMSYSCSGAARVGRFSNPQVTYAGVPQGIDPADSPASGAWNARTLNESASYVASFRINQQVNIPLAPSALEAVSVEFNAVTIAWTDNATDEELYVVQRRDAASSWTTVARLGTNVTSFVDNTVNADSTYEYRVAAANSAGTSEYSAQVVVMTPVQPSEITEFVLSEFTNQGQVSSGFAATYADDGSTQVITETSSGGPKRSRRQAYQHVWNFNISGGAGGSTLVANTWVSGNEGANFAMSLDNGSSWVPLFTVASQSAENSVVAVLGTISGPVQIRVTDAEQSSGEAVDSLYVDQLIIRTSTTVPEAPLAPSDLVVTATTAAAVMFEFNDNAENELGFTLYRATSDPLGNCAAGEAVTDQASLVGTGLTTISDETVQANSEYFYWVTAFNAGGESLDCSNAVNVVTEATRAELTVSGFKQKGVQNAELQWLGLSGEQVEIYRDGQRIATVANSGQSVDNIGQKGAGSYRYQVCELAQAACTPEQIVVF